MTLTWTDIDARWPGAGVAWDQLGAPFDPRLEVHADTLWALSGTCMSNEPAMTNGRGGPMLMWMQGQGETHRHDCRCLAWCDGAWMTQPEFVARGSIATFHGLSELVASTRESLGPIRFVLTLGQSNGTCVRDTYGIFRMQRDQPRQLLRGSRAQRKRKRAALVARR